MRILCVLALIPLPAAAWEFSPEPICTLSHTDGSTDIVLTYDATVPEYSITVSQDQNQWPDGIFVMEFQGMSPLTISTGQQTLSAGRETLTVRDSGFGNVLNGLEFNTQAFASVGPETVSVSLNDIGPAMTAFRSCPLDVPATS